jgi:hypothetical protein
MSYRDDEFQGMGEQQREARKKAYPLPNIVTLADFLGRKIEQPPELVSGLIHQGTMTMINAPSKSMKSWLMFQLALSVASGGKFLGRETSKADVLIVNPEIREPFMQQRMRQLAAAMKSNDCGLDMNAVRILNLRGESFMIETLIDQIAEAAEGFGLVCLDSLYQLLGDRDENAARDMGNLLRGLDKIATSGGAAFLFTHHFAKGNAASKDVLDRSSGSGVLARYPDGIITMTRHKEESTFVIEPVLRNFPPVQPFGVRFEHPLMLLAPDLNPGDLRGKGGPKKQYDLSDTFNRLEDGMTRQKWFTKMARLTGMSDGTFRNHLKELLAQERIEAFGKKQFRRKIKPHDPNHRGVVVSFKETEGDPF